MLMVNVKVKAGRRDEFLAAIQEDAASTTEKEEGNFQFTVVQDNEDPDAFFFLEVYKDEAALGVHREMPHFLKYREATLDIYETATVRRMGTNIFPDDSYWTA
ncbi:MAG: putative quinol monooxygenase [Chloroflexi bacterium]|nr:putative quinol monooxygenase [Chloroflexota bacterium]